MRADVLQVRPVRQRVLSDDIDVAAIKIRVAPLLRRDKALAENHVGGTETTRVGAAKQNRITRHFRIDQVAFGFLQQFFTELRVIGQLAVRTWKRRGEHVMAEPESKQVPVLLVGGPMEKDRGHRHECEQRRHDGKPDSSPANQDEHQKYERQREQQETRIKLGPKMAAKASLVAW